MLSTVQVFAAGATGQEQMVVNVGDTSFDVTVGGNPGELQEFTFEVENRFFPGLPVSINGVTIEFVNDAFDPSTGLDRNLTVDKVVIDGVAYEAEDSSVYSTGTFNGDSLVSGFGLGETLYGLSLIHI